MIYSYKLHLFNMLTSKNKTIGILQLIEFGFGETSYKN